MSISDARLEAVLAIATHPATPPHEARAALRSAQARIDSHPVFKDEWQERVAMAEFILSVRDAAQALSDAFNAMSESIGKINLPNPD